MDGILCARSMSVHPWMQFEACCFFGFRHDCGIEALKQAKAPVAAVLLGELAH